MRSITLFVTGQKTSEQRQFVPPAEGGGKEMNMNQKEQKELQEKKEHDKFNSVTQKSKVENQNQTHNVRKEGIAPIKQKR